MCLWVLRKEHHELEPLVAEEDMLVLKVLTIREPDPTDKRILNETGKWIFNEEKIYTPFMRQPVVFDDDGKCEIQERDLGSDMKEDKYGASFGFGVHSLAYTAHQTKMLNPKLEACERLGTFVAVIPKGSRYYVGQDWDYASDRLIIYYDKEKVPEGIKKT